MRKILAHIVFGLLIAVPASGQRVDTYASTDSVTVGERFQLSVIVGHDGTRRALFPHQLLPDSIKALNAPFSLGDFDIIGVLKEGGRPYADGGRIDSVVYEATTFALDSARVAGIPVGLATELDTLLGVSSPFLLPVVSLVPEDATEIKDIAPLAEFPRSIWPWIVGGLMVIAAMLGLWWWRKKQQEGDSALVEEVLETPPYDEAVTRLTQLSAYDLSDPASVKPFYIELTDILRTYVGRRTHIPALESTTRELLERLRHSAHGELVPGDVLTHIDEVLSHADLVKFADLKPILEQSRKMVVETRDAIEGTESVFRARDEQRRAAERARLEAQQYAPKDALVEEEQH